MRRSKGEDEWTALIRDAHEGYISWEAYVKNQQRMRDNAARRPNKGAPREGRALLTGILLCGRCGRRMTVRYNSTDDARWTYVCAGENTRGAKVCWTVSGAAVDAAVEELLLRMIIPGELDLTIAVEREVASQSASLSEQWKLRLEKAQSEARRAERRYMAVDPDNRVVARTLEAAWEASLQELEAVRRQYDDAARQRRVVLTAEDRARVRELARDLPGVWRAPTTTPAERKAMLRIVIEAVAIRPVDVPERQTHIEVQWTSGAVDELMVPRIRTHRITKRCIARLRELVELGLPDTAIAQKLNAEHFTTGIGRRWSASAVKRMRIEHTAIRRAPRRDARQPLPDRHPDGRYSVRGAMKRFGVSSDKVRRWITRGLVEAVREDFEWCEGAWWLSIDDATAKRLEADAAKRRRTKTHGNAGVPVRR